MLTLKAKYVIVSLALSSFSIHYLNCSRDEKSPAPGELSFRVDATLLENEFVEKNLGFSFSPPGGCTRLPDELTNRALASLPDESMTGDSSLVRPQHVFFNQKDGVACIISVLPHLTTKQSEILSYQNLVRQNFPAAKLDQGQFRHNNIDFSQTLIMTTNTVIFKLVIPRDHRSLQFDYVIPQHIYIDKIRAIESSIGSINMINPS
jgi:hypothetical protein